VGSKSKLLSLCLTLAVIPEIAFAYVGPGAGISLIGALWGLIVGVVMALGIVLFWPIRIMLRKRKAAAEGKDAEATTQENVAEEPAADSTEKPSE